MLSLRARHRLSTAKINKAIFFIDYSFNERDRKRFGIEILEENGFDVEVWDFTPLLRPEVFKKIPDAKSFSGLRRFSDREAALSAIRGLTESCFVVQLVEYKVSTISIYRALSKNDIPYAVFIANALPFGGQGAVSSFMSKIKGVTIKKLMNFIFSRIPPRYLGVKPPTLILAGGERSANVYHYHTGSATKTLWLHTLDYDLYLEESKRPLNATSGTVVFLDAYLPFHSDYLCLGMPPHTSAEEYYPRLCEFFDLIEKELGKKVLIAAHPRAEYENHPEYFGGRPMIKGKTAQLVRESDWVLLHASTALNFAVLFDKPVSFITTDMISESPQGPLIESMAAMVGSKVHNLNSSQSVNWEEELSVDKMSYARYRNDFIKKDGSAELPFWQIFADYISGQNIRILNEHTDS